MPRTIRVMECEVDEACDIRDNQAAIGFSVQDGKCYVLVVDNQKLRVETMESLRAQVAQLAVAQQEAQAYNRRMEKLLAEAKEDGGKKKDK